MPVHQFPLFKEIFYAQDVLLSIASVANLSFAPGLFDAINASAPPTVHFFKNLPSHCFKIWAVYVLVFQKKGHTTRIYIGSGTNCAGRVRTRWTGYDRRDPSVMPRFVDKAFKDGYKIVHKGLLVWAPMPAAANVPIFRLLFVAMEAALSFVFWAMVSRTKDYKMGSACPWPRRAFTYHGLCSHNALLDGIKGNFDLTQEQLEHMAEVARERKRRQTRESYARMYAMNPEPWLARSREYDAKVKAENPEKLLEKAARSKEKMRDLKRFHCVECNMSLSCQTDLDKHLNSKRHKLRFANKQAGVVHNFFCDLCGYSSVYQTGLDRHNTGATHKKRAAAAAKLAATESLDSD